MQPLQFDETKLLRNYHYADRITSAVASSSSKNKRLGKELADLSDSLPLSLSSSVWVRVMEGRMDCLQVMISGPEGTPYSNGLFLFDAHFPESYPNEPPKVNLQTTGRGSVRFNPNLYNNGKVCLSLLGTWRGEAGESWSPATSTFLQALVSIQSLILVPEPYFNEPGYEATMGTPAGIAESKAYNDKIKIATVQWAMVDQLQKPTEGFEDVIRKHFVMKKDEILRQMEEWGSDTHQARVASRAEFGAVRQRLQPLLLAL
jgi:baculoviral IAP repeat-containing protein 6